MEATELFIKYAKNVRKFKNLCIFMIYLYLIESKKIYVIKEVDTSNMSEKQSYEALEEINIMGIVDSPCIVKYYDSFVSNNTKINIIMEFCEHGDLHSFLKKLHGKYLNENKIWKLFIQISLGMHHLHS